jgi:hypothetical protein
MRADAVFLIVHSAIDHLARGQLVTAGDLGTPYGAPLDDDQIGRLVALGALVPADPPTAAKEE